MRKVTQELFEKALKTWMRLLGWLRLGPNKNFYLPLYGFTIFVATSVDLGGAPAKMANLFNIYMVIAFIFAFRHGLSCQSKEEAVERYHKVFMAVSFTIALLIWASGPEMKVPMFLFLVVQLFVAGLFWLPVLFGQLFVPSGKPTITMTWKTNLLTCILLVILVAGMWVLSSLTDHIVEFYLRAIH